MAMLVALEARAEERLPPKIQIRVLLASLVYDMNLSANRGGQLRIGVISPPEGAAKQREAEGVYSALKKYSSKRVQGLSIHAELIKTNQTADLGAVVSAKRLNVLFLAPGLDPMIPQLSALARRRKLLTLTGESAYLTKGVAIGAVRQGKGTRVMVNLQAATAQGARLNSRLLRVADVVD